MSVQSLIQDTSLSGRNMTFGTISFFSALAITDTLDHYAVTIGQTIAIPYDDWNLSVISTLNQAASLYLYSDLGNVIYTGGGTSGYNIATSLPSYHEALLTQSDLMGVGSTFSGINLRVTCATAPTSGSVTIRAIARR